MKTIFAQGATALRLLPLASAAVPLAFSAPAVAISLSSASATSTAPVSAENFDWRGVFLMSSDSDSSQRTYIQISSSPTSGLSTATVWSWNGGDVAQRGSILFDQAQSTPLALVGRYRRSSTDPGATMTLRPFAGNQYATVLVDQGINSKPSYMRRVTEIGAVAEMSSGTALRDAVTGTWDTTLGALKVWRSGDGTYGEITKPGSTTPLHSIVLRATRGEYMIWTSRKSSEEQFEMIMSPDDQQFETFVPATYTPIGNSRNWSGKRGTVAAPAVSRLDVVGKWQSPFGPFEFVTQQNFGTVVITTFRNGLDGQTYQMLVPRIVDGTKLEAEWRSTSGPQLIGKAHLTLTNAGNTLNVTEVSEGAGIGGKRTWIATRAGTASAPSPEQAPTDYTIVKGRWYSPLGAFDVLPAGESATIKFKSKVDGRTYTVTLTPDTKPGNFEGKWQTSDPGPFQRGRASFWLADGGKTLNIVELTESAGMAGSTEWQATRVAPVPAPPSTPPIVQPPAPQPPEVSQPQAPLPGTVQAGQFHQLERFNVRADEIRAGRDGKVHLLLTVANKSGQARSIGQGTFTAVMSDAEGVGILTETPWQVSGDEPKTFDLPPTIAAGAEFKVRFLMEPGRVHGPLRRIGLRESNKKVIFFDASRADLNSETSAPPPPGGGSFKSLSKLDVRIDRMAAARDGRMEVFVTFRNPTQAPVSVNAAAQRLSGTNSDGSEVRARHALHSVRGERGDNDALPVPFYVEGNGEARVRYVFDDAPAGALTITDGTVTQTFTPGG